MPSISVSANEKQISIAGSSFDYVFDRIHGEFSEIRYNGVSMLAGMPRFNIWRAPTDNERWLRKQWEKHGYDKMQTHMYSVEITEKDEKHIKLCCKFSLGTYSLLPVVKAEAFWTIYGSGDIILEATAKVRKELPFLPRFGLQLRMPVGNELVEYFGYGPHESYIDKRRSTRKSRYESTVDGMHENYIMPQENGSHYMTEWAAVTNLLGMGLLFAGMDSFSFNASHYTPEDLTEAMHTCELKKRAETIVNIDYMMSGVGSNSCGPELLPQYRLSQNDIAFSLRIKPIFKEEASISEIAGTRIE
jgi:beta-galactosidase